MPDPADTPPPPGAGAPTPDAGTDPAPAVTPAIALIPAVNAVLRLKGGRGPQSDMSPADVAARAVYEALRGVDRQQGTEYAREWYPLANQAGFGHRGRPWPY